MEKPTCTFSYGGLMCTSVFSFIPQEKEKKINNKFLNIFKTRQAICMKFSVQIRKVSPFANMIYSGFNGVSFKHFQVVHERLGHTSYC